MTSSLETSADGFRTSIARGLQGLKTFGSAVCSPPEKEPGFFKKLLEEADAVVVGAGAGLSTAAGFTYSGERFRAWFADFQDAFGIKDMYSGGFYPFPDDETYWAWWARHIYVNRYIPAPRPVYAQLMELLKGKDYFVVTTNVDHQFLEAGVDPSRFFYTQGDYGELQAQYPQEQVLYSAKTIVRDMMTAQGYQRDVSGYFQPCHDVPVRMRVPSELVPRSEDGLKLVPHLRSDDSFVEDAAWHQMSASYAAFLEKHKTGRVLYWEIGVGANTPVIIKYPFWQYTYENPDAFYVCINKGEAYCPEEIAERAICIDGDIGEVLERL